MFFDLPLEKLHDYQTPDVSPADFDAFWQQTLAETAVHPLAAQFTPVRDPIYRQVDVADVTFAGWGGQSIRGWLLTPAGAAGRLPCIVSYVGYGGGRGLPVDHLAPLMAGCAHFVMDTRGQGAVWAPGDTPDDHGSDPQHPGFMTRGILARETYYYRRVYVDAVRAVAAAAAHPRVDPARIAVAGGSQGGGIALAAGALAGQAVKAVIADVPFLCAFRRAMDVTDRPPYAEIALYLRCQRGRAQRVFETLAYFDGVHFAPRITAPCLFSVALMDLTCPPSTVFAAYNRVVAPKELRVYDYNDHEGGGSVQIAERLRFVQAQL
jgi:cephalosporin-C deacetylase